MLKSDEIKLEILPNKLKNVKADEFQHIDIVFEFDDIQGPYLQIACKEDWAVPRVSKIIKDRIGHAGFFIKSVNVCGIDYKGRELYSKIDMFSVQYKVACRLLGLESLQ